MAVGGPVAETVAQSTPIAEDDCQSGGPLTMPRKAEIMIGGYIGTAELTDDGFLIRVTGCPMNERLLRAALNGEVTFCEWEA